MKYYSEESVEKKISRLSKEKMFKGKVGFHKGKKPRVSARKGEDTIKKMFGFN